MSILDSKSKIKVLLVGRDNVTRKHFVDHDAQFFETKYRIDPDAIILTLEPGTLGFGGSTVPTIIFRENSIEPISKKHPGTIPSPEEFGENVNRAANAIAILRAQKDDEFKTVMYILMALAILAAAIGGYYGYQNDKKIVELSTKMDAISASIVAIQPGFGTGTGTGTNMFFNQTSGKMEIRGSLV